MIDFLYLLLGTQVILSLVFFMFLGFVRENYKEKLNDYQLINKYLIFNRQEDLKEIKKRNIEYFLRQKEREVRSYKNANIV
jgi:hypothetical protein